MIFITDQYLNQTKPAKREKDTKFNIHRAICSTRHIKFKCLILDTIAALKYTETRIVHIVTVHTVKFNNRPHL